MEVAGEPGLVTVEQGTWGVPASSAKTAARRESESPSGCRAMATSRVRVSMAHEQWRRQ